MKEEKHIFSTVITAGFPTLVPMLLNGSESTFLRETNKNIAKDISKIFGEFFVSFWQTVCDSNLNEYLTILAPYFSSVCL